MPIMGRKLLLCSAVIALSGAAGCSGVSSILRYGADGQPEYFVDCSGRPMTSCYSRALNHCPQGYFLVKDEQVPDGSKSGTIWGQYKAVGGAANNVQTNWKNQVVIRCKESVAAAAAPR